MNKIKEIFDNLLKSLTSEKGGYSVRKLTSITLIVCVVYGHIKYVEQSNFVEVLSIDYIMVLLLLGLVTFSQVIELKNGKHEDNKQKE